VRQGVLEKNLVFEGQVEFGQVADLASPETARLIRADLQLGVRVEAGAVLIELAPDTARAETQAARIWLDKTYLSQLASLLAERAAAMERTGKAVAATSAKIL
jgi:multidrug efflux pump subunit AcrA (membrane-fusion protein)